MRPNDCPASGHAAHGDTPDDGDVSVGELLGGVDDELDVRPGADWTKDGRGRGEKGGEVAARDPRVGFVVWNKPRHKEVPVGRFRDRLVG